MVKVLDTTLRDGSYVIDFQFTPKDTAIIGHALDEIGLDFIEVGHGLGLGAGSKPQMKSPASDEAYLVAAANAIKNTDWGMFFIPGIGSIEDIDLAAEHGMKFIRIGTDVDRSEIAEKYIARAKSHGMYVAANFMKTYAATPEYVGNRAKEAQKFGADIVCIVDSAGGMIASELESYYNGIRDVSDIEIGFHGHNNLGLAMSNTLKAVELGCSVVDTSIRGMGRSAGNAVTEMLLFTLDRMNLPYRADVSKVLNIAEQLIDPLLKDYQQVSSIGIVSGYAQFHSAYLGKIYQYADLYNIDPKKLIIEVSKVNKITVNDELVEEQAIKIKENNPVSVSNVENFNIPTYHYDFTDQSFENQLKHVLDQAHSLSKKHFTKSVLNVVQSRSNSHASVSQVVNEGNAFTVVSVEVAGSAECKVINELCSGLIDIILLDCDINSANSKLIIEEITSGSIKVVRYSDLEVWSKSICSLILDLISDRSDLYNIGGSRLQSKVQNDLESLGIVPKDIKEYKVSGGEDFLISFDSVPEEILSIISSNATIIDARIGSIDSERLRDLTVKGVRVIRPQMHSFILAELESRCGTNQRHISVMGVGSIDGIQVTSGGQIAARGTVVLDNVHNPKKIFGIANGMGFLVNSNELLDLDRENLKNLERIISLKFLENEW